MEIKRAIKLSCSKGFGQQMPSSILLMLVIAILAFLSPPQPLQAQDKGSAVISNGEDNAGKNAPRFPPQSPLPFPGAGGMPQMPTGRIFEGESTAKRENQEAVLRGADEHEQSLTIDASGEWDKLYSDLFFTINNLTKITSERAANNSSVMVRGLPDELFAKFKDLGEQNRLKGVTGLPRLSLRLLDRSIALKSSGDTTSAVQALNLALDLTPNDSEVNFAASRFMGLLGMKRSLTLFVKGVIALTDQPVSLTYHGMFLLLLIIGSVFVSLIITCLVQILINMDILLTTFSSAIPMRVRGWVSPLLLLFVLVLPVRTGILVTVITWSLLIALLLPKRGALHWAVGLFCIFGLLFLSATLRLGRVFWDDLVEIERLNNGQMSSQYPRVLIRSPQEGEINFVRRAVAGNVLLRFGRFKEAEDLLREELAIAVVPDQLRVVNLTNLGAALIAQGKHEQARPYLEIARDLGGSTFEVNFNLAQIYIVKVEMEPYRQALELARGIDPLRFDDFQMRRDAGVPWVAKTVPSKVIYNCLWNELVGSGASSRTGNETSSDEFLIAQVLSPFGSFAGLYAFCVAEFSVYSLMCLRRRKMRIFSQVRFMGRVRPSLVWVALPAGYQIAGTRPLQGTFFLSFMIAFLAIFAGVGRSSTSLISGEIVRSWSMFFGWVVLATYFLASLIAVYQWYKDGKCLQRG